MKQTLALTLVALLLTACGERAGTPAENEPEPAATGSEPVKGQSIIRPDIEEAKELPLEPLTMRIGFADGGFELDEDAKASLSQLFESPQFKAGGAIVLRGHTDSSGRDEANLRAAQARAEAVRDHLVEQGAGEDRFTIIAFGEQNPVEPNALPDGLPNEDGRAANRRVDVTVEVGSSPGSEENPPSEPDEKTET